jgi:hippurate hydrolase
MVLRFALGLVVAVVAAGAQAAPYDPVVAKAEVERVLSRDLPRLDAIYRDIHQNPELAFQEKATAAKLAREMRAAGLTVTEGVGGTGVVAVLKNGPGPTVLVRTELDGLPMAERTGLPYASRAVTTWQGRETAVAHSCGHDIHMAAWVGAARALAALKDAWSGTLIFIGQPAEETTSGAQAMLKDDFVRRFGKPDYAFALHVSPAPAGTVLYRSGPMSSTSDALEIVFHGRGGHGSAPAATIDPVLMAARFTVDVQSLISREKAPEAFGVVTIGAIAAGDAGNVIPDEAVVRGTIRSQDDAVRTKLLAGIRRTAQAVSDMAGAPAATVTITPGGKMVINDPALSERTEAVFKQAFGRNAQPFPIIMSGSEDFSEFVNLGVPSVYFLIGGLEPTFFANALKSGHLPINHSPEFAPEPEPTIATGATAMALAVMNVARLDASRL